jgi:hypothetical protein
MMSGFSAWVRFLVALAAAFGAVAAVWKDLSVPQRVIAVACVLSACGVAVYEVVKLRKRVAKLEEEAVKVSGDFEAAKTELTDARVQHQVELGGRDALLTSANNRSLSLEERVTELTRRLDGVATQVIARAETASSKVCADIEAAHASVGDVLIALYGGRPVGHTLVGAIGIIRRVRVDVAALQESPDGLLEEVRHLESLLAELESTNGDERQMFRGNDDHTGHWQKMMDDRFDATSQCAQKWKARVYATRIAWLEKGALRATTAGDDAAQSGLKQAG